MKVKVLHVITKLELGGAQKNTLDTVRQLSRDRFSVGLACGLGGELFPEAESLGDVAFFPVPHLFREVRPLSDLRALGELRLVIRNFAPDIVHTHSSKAGILGRLAAFAEGVPVVVHSIHGFGFGAHQWWPIRTAFLAAERFVARVTTEFVAVSGENAQLGVSLGLFPQEKVQVIRSGIDLFAFRHAVGGEAVRKALGIPPQAPVVLQVSCFKPQKAPGRFVELAARVSRVVPEARFLLVGDGELREEVLHLRSRYGLEDKLYLLGWRRDMPALYSAAQVVTLTSLFEGLPRVLVEARAAGLPVVAMAVDGVVEVVENGKNGFLVGDGDLPSMAEKVSWLLLNPEAARAFGQVGQKGLEEFSRETMMAEQEKLYLRLWQKSEQL